MSFTFQLTLVLKAFYPQASILSLSVYRNSTGANDDISVTAGGTTDAHYRFFLKKLEHTMRLIKKNE